MEQVLAPDKLFEIIYNNPKVHGTLRGTIAKFFNPKSQQADDIAQDSFIKVYKKILDNSLEYTEAKICAYVATVAKNACLDILRMQKNRSKLSSTDNDLFFAHAQSDCLFADSNSNSREYWRIYQILLNCLEQIPKEQRTVILLRLDDRSFKEISKILNIPENTVLSQARYARIHLKKILPKNYYLQYLEVILIPLT